jgi:hypothetical protein
MVKIGQIALLAEPVAEPSNCKRSVASPHPHADRASDSTCFMTIEIDS